jgi:hypothetical protein
MRRMRSDCCARAATGHAAAAPPSNVITARLTLSARPRSVGGWFGLLEHRSEKLPSSRFGEHHFYRKMELFDRLLAFDVQVDLSEEVRH